jgi:hypothetical protein
MTTNIFEDYLTQLDTKLVSKNHSVWLFTDHCAGHPKNTFLRNIKVVFLSASLLQPLDLGIILGMKCHYRNQSISKTVAMIDRGLHQDAA